MQLSILNDFCCIADQCPQTCCRDSIDVDSSTLAKWHDLDSSKIQTRMLDALNTSDNRVTLNVDENRLCSLLDSGLCAIQKELGHDYLPEICRQFPRITVGRQSHPVASAYMSCPEIARLVVSIGHDEPVFDGNLFTLETVSSLRTDALRAEKLLQRFLLLVLGTTTVTPAEAIYLVGHILSQMVSSATLPQAIHTLETLCFEPDSLQEHIARQRKRFRNRQLLLKKQKAGEMWWLVTSTCRALHDKDYLSQWRTVFPGIEPHVQQMPDPVSFYTSVSKLKNSANLIPETIQQGLDRYLQVKFVNHGFPMACHASELVLTYLDCVVGFSQVMLLLWLSGTDRPLQEEDLVRAIYRVERGLVHNDQLRSRLLQYASQPDMDGYILSFLYLS